MENKKYEQLIDLIINEQEDKARELFHDIVVEKSREIYENIMDEEMTDPSMDEGDMVGEVGSLMDEISAEESGVVEAEDEADADIEFDDEAEEDEGMMYGFTENYVKVKVPFNASYVNSFQKVKLTAIDRDGIMKVEVL